MSQIILFSNLLEMSQGMYRKQEFALITIQFQDPGHIPFIYGLLKDLLWGFAHIQYVTQMSITLIHMCSFH